MKIAKILPFVALVLCAACTKEEQHSRLQLVLEPMGGATKLAVDETVATWSDGDAIRFNGSVVTIIREDNGHAYIDDALAGNPNRALFPASLAASGPSGDNISVSLPAEYQYRTSASQQLLDLPLAARATGNDPLHMLHLTGALCFTIENNRSTDDLTIDRVTVASSGYQLSGTMPVDLTAIASIAARPTATAADREVSLAFDHESLTIPHGESRTVMLPVAAVGDTNHFTITVSAHHQGSRYTFTRRQSGGGALARNQLGYVTVSLTDDLSATNLFGGSPATTLLIASETDFRLMVQAINAGWTGPSGHSYRACNYRLTRDLDLSGVSINPIIRYSGTSFDGDGNTVTGLTINSSGGRCALFDTISDATTVRNLTLRNLALQHNGNVNYLYMAAFGVALNHADLSNCHVEGLTCSASGTITNYIYFGGLAATANSSCTFSNCSVTASPTLSLSSGKPYCGGIVGYASKGAGSDNALTLTDCSATLTSFSITSSNTTYFGGIVGYITNEVVSLTRCAFQSNATLNAGTSNVTAGGLVGRYVQSAYGSFSTSGCSVSGSLSATGGASSYLGACIGYAQGSYNSLDCTNSLTMTLNGATISNDVGRSS